jgi:hypothetical protein
MYWDIAADIHFPPNFDQIKEISGHHQRSPHRQLQGTDLG